MRRGEPEVAGQRAVAGVDAVDGARRRAPDDTASTITTRSSPAQASSSLRRLVVALEHGRTRGAQPVCDERADGVVAAVAAAEARGRLHARSISSLRKWVAQEMQGS